jgi:crotonobetainyl-CoA:carnitine CoA-transferase CaiB-like acyl-CoA transferase
MTHKPFDKNFTLTPHDIKQQLEALKELLDKRDADMAAQFADTKQPQDEATAFDDLTEAHKAEIKRDKWNRDLTKG